MITTSSDIALSACAFAIFCEADHSLENPEDAQFYTHITKAPLSLFRGKISGALW
jgi:hypothetical protein